MDQATANESILEAKGTISLGGRSFLVDPVGPKHFAIFAKWVRAGKKPEQATPIGSLVRDPDWAKLPKDIQLHMAGIAAQTQIKPKKEHDPETEKEQVAIAMRTEEGCAQFLWLLIRNNHPDTTPKDLVPLVTEETPEYVQFLLNDAANFKALEKLMADEDPDAKN